MTTLTQNPTVRKAAPENCEWYHGSRMAFLANPQDTDGQYTLIETITLAGSEPPPHVHTREDEFFYILEGEATFWAGDREFHGKAGDLVFFPKNVAHAFRLNSPVAKALLIVTPSGFEEFFHTFGVPSPTMDAPPSIATPDITRFIAECERLGASFLPPGTKPADFPMPLEACRPVCRSRQTAERLNVIGADVAVLLSAEDCGGVLSVFDVEVMPQMGVPLHTHRWEDEAIYVVSGTYRMQIGEEMQTVRAGNFVHFPRGVPHSYLNIGSEPGSLLTITTPGGYEAFFREVDSLMKTCAANQSALGAIAQRHGIEIIAPPPSA
jgi:quercetin dioxygenase-like cupin family protein